LEIIALRFGHAGDVEIYTVPFPRCSGSRAKFTAIRRASSRVSTFAWGAVSSVWRQQGRQLPWRASGDVLVVTRLDRLARSTRDLLNVLEAVKQAGAGFRSLKDAWCDTTTPHGVLMLTVPGGLAEFERTLIKAGPAKAAREPKDAACGSGDLSSFPLISVAR
jgi:hypothetical protein